MGYLVFDIETGPADDECLKQFEPAFSAPSNYKDPEKIAASVATQRAEWKERAALSPLTGRVLAIGGLNDFGQTTILTGVEDDILATFWEAIEHNRDIGALIVGFNSHRLDLPFLTRRSWSRGIPVPRLLRGRYLHPCFIDLMEVYQMGDRTTSISLDSLAKLVGLPGKNGSGADFARLFAEDRDAAIDYLENDLRLTRDCAIRLGVIPSGDY